MRTAPLLVLIAACSSGGDAQPPRDEPRETPPSVVVPDAAVAAPPLPDPIATAPSDDTPATHDRRRLQIMLTSSPSGTLAKVDGKAVGTTPAYWEGEFTGRPRTFTFEEPGYFTATYSFVPIKDGFVHGRLERILVLDAGVP